MDTRVYTCYFWLMLSLSCHFKAQRHQQMNSTYLLCVERVYEAIDEDTLMWGAWLRQDNRRLCLWYVLWTLTASSNRLVLSLYGRFSIYCCILRYSWNQHGLVPWPEHKYSRQEGTVKSRAASKRREKTKGTNDRHLRHPISPSPCVCICVCPAFCTEVITLTRDLEDPAEFRQGSITPFTHTCTKSSRPALFVSNNRYVLPLTHKYRHTPTAQHQQWKQTPLPWFLLKIQQEVWAMSRPQGCRKEKERGQEPDTAWPRSMLKHTLLPLFFSFTTLFCLPLLSFLVLSLLEIKSSRLHWTYSYPLCAEKCHFLCFIILFPPLWEAGRKVCFEERGFNMCANK